MNPSSPIPPVPEDVQYFDEAVELIKRVYVMYGHVNPVAMIHSHDPDSDKWITRWMEAPVFSSQEDKNRFVAGIQHAGLAVGSTRAVLVLESYAVFASTPEAAKLRDEIHARGGSITEHPDHFESVLMTLESDWGSISQTFRINRLHQEMVELIPAEEIQLHARDDREREIKGTFTGFHVPTFVRETDEGKAYARMLAGTFNIDAASLPQGPGSKAN